jgi:TrmH family RNA methyltransferase
MLTSLSNPHIKFVRKLKDRKTREESGLFLVEGLRIVGEALSLNATIEQIIYSPDLLISDFGKRLITEQTDGIEKLEVSVEIFRSISSKDGPQGIAAICQQEKKILGMPGTPSLYVALEAVQDPGNLGTILRTSDAVGVAGVIILENSVDLYDPAVCRGSMGAIFSVPIFHSAYSDLSTWINQYKLPVIGTSDSGNVDYQEFQYPESMVLMMGSEQKGLSKPYLQLCTQVVKIPMVGRADSLNLAVATAVGLYEIFSQHRKK